MVRTETKIRDARARIEANEDWIREHWSGFSYGEGLTEMIAWVLGDITDEELFDDVPK